MKDDQCLNFVGVQIKKKYFTFVSVKIFQVRGQYSRERAFVKKYGIDKDHDGVLGIMPVFADLTKDNEAYLEYRLGTC